MHIYDKVLIAGLVLCFVGFGFAWTDRFDGLRQVIFPDAYEAVGTWLMRIGIVLAFGGSLVHVAAQLAR